MYQNKFDSDGNENAFVKRSTIIKDSRTYYPEFKNPDGTKKYIISYDPSSKLDNSVITIAEIFKDEERGWMLKIVNCVNLIEVTKSGEKMVIQKPEQVEMLKDIILNYNLGSDDYQNIEQLILDAGAGG